MAVRVTVNLPAPAVEALERLAAKRETTKTRRAAVLSILLATLERQSSYFWPLGMVAL